MQTDRFSFTLGLEPGYYNEGKDLITIEILNERWKALAKQRGIYVSAISEKCHAIYPGCPIGGELIARFTGTRNPEKVSDELRDSWIEAVSWICEEMRKLFKQTTAQVEFDKVEMFYLK